MTNNPAARFPIVAYRAKPGKEAELDALARERRFFANWGLRLTGRIFWPRYAEVCNFVPLNSLEESAQMFANFTPAN